MRSLLLQTLFAVLALAVFAPTADAIGMGRVNVMSSLGQRLQVEIEIIGLEPQDRGALSVKLGSARAYELANLPLGAVTSIGIRASIEQRTNGVPFIRVTSSQPVNEPFVNLVLELMSPSGPVSRHFSVLLDPPEITLARSAEVEPRPPAAVTEKPKAPDPAPVHVADIDYGPVRPGETLSRIAAKVRPQNATLEQTMVGIFRNNPTAFINNNMNLLKVGHRLRIPEPGQLAPPAESAREFRAQVDAWASGRATTTTESKAPKPGPAPSPPKPAAAKGGEGGKPVVKVSRGAVGKDAPVEERLRMLEEDLAARERALQDANERIKRLEKAIVPAPAQK